MYVYEAWHDGLSLSELHRLVHRVQVEEFGLVLKESYWHPLHDIAAGFDDGSGVPAFWVALREGAIVGCVGLKRLSAQAAEIKRMLVLPEHRGMEVGSCLMEAAYARAQETGVTFLYLGTGDAKLRALRFYEKQGFGPVAMEALPPEYVIDPLDGLFFVKEIAG